LFDRIFRLFDRTFRGTWKTIGWAPAYDRLAVASAVTSKRWDAKNLPVASVSTWPARTGQRTDSTVRSASRSSHSSDDDGFPLRSGPPLWAPHRSWTTQCRRSIRCLRRREPDIWRSEEVIRLGSELNPMCSFAGPKRSGSKGVRRSATQSAHIHEVPALAVRLVAATIADRRALIVNCYAGPTAWPAARCSRLVARTGRFATQRQRPAGDDVLFALFDALIVGRPTLRTRTGLGCIGQAAR